MASKIIGPRKISAQRLWGGPGTILGGGAGDPPGLASRAGAPASIPLLLFWKFNMQPVGYQWSQSNGHYLFSNLALDQRFVIVGFDHLGAWQASAVDQIAPKGP